MLLFLGPLSRWPAGGLLNKNREAVRKRAGCPAWELWLKGKLVFSFSQKNSRTIIQLKFHQTANVCG